MKKLIKTLSVTLSIVLFVTELTSCGNFLMKDIDTVKQQPSSRQTGSITGSYTVEGAVPSTLLNARQANSRTAFPRLDIGSGEATFVVEAIPDTAGYETKYGTFNDKNFSITGLVLDIPYTIKARLISNFDESILLEGTASEKVTLTSASPTKAIGTIKLLPAQTAEGTGDIYLCIDTSEVTNKPSKVNVSLEKVTDESALDPQTFNYSDGFNIDIEDVPSGAWNMQISVYSRTKDYEQDVLVFRCTEVVNVFDNLLTDLWVKNGNEAYLVCNSSGTDFKLTDDIIEKFQKTTFYVDTSLAENGSGSYFSPFNSVQTALTELLYYNPDVEKTLLIRGNGSNEKITTPFTPDSRYNLTIETYKANDQDTGKFTITADGNYAFYVYNGSTLNISGLSFEGAGGFENGGDGGFFYISNGTATFTDCTFTNGNTCGLGGAIYNEGTLNLTGCTFSENTDNRRSNNNAIWSNGKVYLFGNKNSFSDDPICLSYTDNLNAIYLDTSFSQNGTEVIKVKPDNPDRFIDKNVLLSSVSGNLSAFTLVDCDGYVIYGNGKLKHSIEVSGEGNTSYPATLDAALNIGGMSWITLLGGYTYESNNTTFGNGGSEITLEVADGGTAIVEVKGSLYLEEGKTFYANNITFVGNWTNQNLGGLFYIDEGAEAIFSNCTFKNGKSNVDGGALYVKGKATLENCTFESNYMNSNKPNDVVVYCGSLTLKGKNSFSSPICCNRTESDSPSITVSDIELTSGTSYAEISCFYLNDLSFVKPGFQIISGLKSGQESWFPCVDEGYGIDADGKIKQKFTAIPGPGELPEGSLILAPDSSTSVDNLTAFLTTEGTFTVDLDLSSLYLDKNAVTTLVQNLNHVESLTIPLNCPLPDHCFDGGQNGVGCNIPNLKKIIIKGDLPGAWLFQGSQIEEVVFEEGCTRVNSGMFAQCTKLAKVTLPSTLKTIEHNAFPNTKISEIIIPASVEVIQHNMFLKPDNDFNKECLTKVIFEDATSTWTIKNKNTGSLLSYKTEHISVADPELNAEMFKDTYGTSENCYWYKDKQSAAAAANVGDIILSDGSVIQYSEGLSLSEEQKANAIAVIFYKGTNLNNDGNTSTVRTLGIGLQQALNLMWCTTDASGYSLSPESMQCELASSSTTETLIETNTHRNGKDNFNHLSTYMDENSIMNDTSYKEKYPAFYFAIDYAGRAQNVSGTAYENDWYLPSMAELLEMYNNMATVNSALEKCGVTQLSGSYRSSSPGLGLDSKRAYSISMNDGLWSNMVKETPLNICAIIEFN